VLLVGVPGLLATLTRGPILATAIAVVGLLVLGRTRIAGIGVLAVAALAIAIMLPSLKTTEIYRDRIAEQSNVQFRQVVQEWSIRLAAEKPLFGWGYGSFDRVKNASGFTAEGVPIRNILEYTSHDTYLTILVEYGGLGLLLLVLPFAIVGLKAVRRARARAGQLGHCGFPGEPARDLHLCFNLRRPLLLVRADAPIRASRRAAAGRCISFAASIAGRAIPR
jgi:O-antigen ligase